MSELPAVSCQNLIVCDTNNALSRISKTVFVYALHDQEFKSVGDPLGDVDGNPLGNDDGDHLGKVDGADRHLSLQLPLLQPILLHPSQYFDLW